MLEKIKYEAVFLALLAGSAFLLFSGFQFEEWNIFDQRCIQARVLRDRPSGFCLRPEWLGIGIAGLGAAFLFWKRFLSAKYK